MSATDARYLNDREELIHAEQFADKLLEAAPELDDEGFPQKDWLTKARRMAPVQGIQIFVACFTTEEDQLSQWRAYSHESSGVSLAFDLRSARPPVGDDTTVAFAPCIYSGETTTALVKEALRSFTEEVGSYYKKVYELACQRDAGMRTRADKAQVVKEFLDLNPTEKQLAESYVKAVSRTRVHYLQVGRFQKTLPLKRKRNGGWYCRCLKIRSRRLTIRRSSEPEGQLLFPTSPILLAGSRSLT